LFSFAAVIRFLGKPQVAAIIIRRPSSTFYVFFPSFHSGIGEKLRPFVRTAAVSAGKVSVILNPKNDTPSGNERSTIRIKFNINSVGYSNESTLKSRVAERVLIPGIYLKF
jgi:hypothetical protein